MTGRNAAVVPYPWGASLGLARSVIFGGMGLTLLSNPAWVIFTRSAMEPTAPRCDLYNRWALFCLAEDHLDLARVAAGVSLLAFATGFLPWLTAVPGAYLVLSASATMTLGDGGDQLFGILALFVISISVTDWRWSSWARDMTSHWATLRGSVAFSGWLLVRAQVFVVYAEAAVGKLAVPEWANGTALYYWLRNPTFGPSEALAPAVQAVTAVPVITGPMTFSVIALEMMLAFGPAFTIRIRRCLFVAGVVMHVAIIAFMGITSFSIVMFGALLLHLPPMSATLGEILPRKRDWHARDATAS